MVLIGVDDTDSATAGMCTTYVATAIADRLTDAGARVGLPSLIRLNPAVEHKTRGNAAVAFETDASATVVQHCARSAIEEYAHPDAVGTDPGVVIADHPIAAMPRSVRRFSTTCLHRIVRLDAASDLIESQGYLQQRWGHGRGVIGALAAVGAMAMHTSWTYELIAYREPARWGTPRTVDSDSVAAAAAAAYPSAWDTYDHAAAYPVCVPRTPCPVLYGIRGETPEVVRSTAATIAAEPVSHRQLFRTNQGTDAHIRAPEHPLRERTAYRLPGAVDRSPQTREGGHVFIDVETVVGPVTAAAFEPTKQFRDVIRALVPGDRLTLYGTHVDGRINLEKIHLRALRQHTWETPPCTDCGARMSSAGRTAGYRCDRCGTTAAGKVRRPHRRTIAPGWYEVPPSARRHLARPLVRQPTRMPISPRV
jgi:tRNA(Ile2)-agmatinylcytidine synthase